jgi:hypothetical protein
VKRSLRRTQAEETVEIVKRGSYRSVGGRDVDIGEAVRACLAGTAYFRPDALERLRARVLSEPPAAPVTTLEVARETTLA